ncbi:MAG: S-adenosylmethionine decarboxylase proenzyme [Polyangiaceae bacterium]
MIGTRAKHLLVEYEGCDPAILDDLERMTALMREAAVAAGATVVAEAFHRYRPQGVTGVLVIEESHFSVHTWPEHGYAALDFYTCGDCEPERADEVLRRALRAKHAEVALVERGLRLVTGSMQLVERRSGPVLPRAEG